MPRKAKPDEPKKPRRKKKAETPPETAEVAAQPPAEVIEPPQEQSVAEPQEPAPAEPEPPSELAMAAHHHLPIARPRKSGRRAWDINLGGGGHTWERVETPDHLIVFRFKDDPSSEQHALIERFGFGYNEETKEAYRQNDAGGRVYADKLAWFLKDLQRSESQGRAAG